MAMNVGMSHKYDDNDDNDGNDDHDDYDDYHYCNCYQQILVVNLGSFANVTDLCILTLYIRMYTFGETQSQAKVCVGFWPASHQASGHFNGHRV